MDLNYKLNQEYKELLKLHKMSKRADLQSVHFGSRRPLKFLLLCWVRGRAEAGNHWTNGQTGIRNWNIGQKPVRTDHAYSGDSFPWVLELLKLRAKRYCEQHFLDEPRSAGGHFHRDFKAAFQLQWGETVLERSARRNYLTNKHFYCWLAACGGSELLCGGTVEGRRICTRNR